MPQKITVEKAKKTARDYFSSHGYVSSRHLLEFVNLAGTESDITETLDILEIGIQEWKYGISPLPSRYSEVNGHYCLVYYNPNKSFLLENL